MYKTLLFDLDGTLLDVDMRVFLKEYFIKLGEHLEHVIPPETLVKHLKSSTQVMIDNLDPDKTNKQVFCEDFLKKVNIPAGKMKPLLEDFYQNKFKTLKPFARQLPMAREVMETASRLGCCLVLATNPVFPYLAIKHRLEWSGLEEFPYKLITSYENMHFCKPNLHYFQEILEKAGSQPHQCLMIGNDMDDDMVASKAGIKTFLVEDFLIDRNRRGYHVDYQGTLKDLALFLQEQEL